MWLHNTYHLGVPEEVRCQSGYMNPNIPLPNWLYANISPNEPSGMNEK